MKGIKLDKELKAGKTFRQLSPAESIGGLCKSRGGEEVKIPNPILIQLWRAKFFQVKKENNWGYKFW